MITTPRLQFVLNDTLQNDGRAAYAAANPAPAPTRVAAAGAAEPRAGAAHRDGVAGA